MPASRIVSTHTDAPAAWLLDALPDATALLDRDGTIVAVNRAWRMFSVDNGGTPEGTGVGVNYLDVCMQSATAGCADAAEVAAGLRAVLAGETVESDLEYPCPSPAVGRWFMLRVTPVAGPEPGVMVSHMNVSRRKRAEQELQRQASEDPLTGLSNRMLFDQRLTSALTQRPGRQSLKDVGLLYIDLDGFKPVNDTYGHTAGDEVLLSVAARLSLQTRSEDTLARLGGDEFALLSPRISADGLARQRVRIEHALAAPHLVHGDSVTVGASVGTYLASPGEEPADSLSRADEAMYAVKRARSQQR